MADVMPNVARAELTSVSAPFNDTSEAVALDAAGWISLIWVTTDAKPTGILTLLRAAPRSRTAGAAECAAVAMARRSPASRVTAGGTLIAASAVARRCTLLARFPTFRRVSALSSLLTLDRLETVAKDP